MSTRDLCLRQLTDIVIAMCRMLVCGEAGGDKRILFRIKYLMSLFAF